VIAEGREQARKEIAVTEVITIVNNARDFLSSSPGVALVATDQTNLYQRGVFPQEMRMSDYCPPFVCIDLPWGPQLAGSASKIVGSIFIRPWDPPGPSGRDCGSSSTVAKDGSQDFCIGLIVPSQVACTNLVARWASP